MAKGLTPQQVAEKHIRRTKAAVEDMRRGVEAVTVAPGAQAAAKQEKLIQNWNAAIQEGRWAKRVASVSLDEWKRKMIDKGSNRVAQGLDASAGKIEAFFAELIPFQNDLASKIAKMPDLTLEDSIARATAQIRGMANFRKGRK